MPSDNDVLLTYMAHVCFYVCCGDCVGVCVNVCCVTSIGENSVFLALEYVVCLCRRCDVMDVVFSVCIVRRSALLFIVRSRLLVYSAGSDVNRMQVVLSRKKFMLVSPYSCMYFLAALVLVCMDVIVISSA